MITYKNINLYVDFFILYIISLNKGSRCVVSSLGSGKDYKKHVTGKVPDDVFWFM